MSLRSLDLIVRDVPAAATFFREVLQLPLRASGERYAEVDTGGITIMLSPDALVPTEPARGLILHFEVSDVRSSVEQARERGAVVLRELTVTDWGWESALLQGPEDIVIDLFRVVAGGTPPPATA